VRFPRADRCPRCGRAPALDLTRDDARDLLRGRLDELETAGHLDVCPTPATWLSFAVGALAVAFFVAFVFLDDGVAVWIRALAFVLVPTVSLAAMAVRGLVVAGAVVYDKQHMERSARKARVRGVPRRRRV
jgi:hypothetical protein